MVPSVPRRAALFALAAGLVLALCPEGRAQEGAVVPHWVWHPNPATQGNAGAESRWFRKVFHVKEPSRIALDATADNAFTLYLDGKAVLEGDNWGTARSFAGTVPTGRHVLAVVATNEAPGPAGVLVRGGVLPLGQGVPIHTDASWRASDKAPTGDDWMTNVDFDQRGWLPARDLGALGVAPWGVPNFESGDNSGRFKPAPGLVVTTAAPAALTGSAVSLGFDEEGRPCVGIERGPIVRLVDADKDGAIDGRQVVTDQVKNSQGFSFVDGQLYAVGDGPKGAGIYRLSDKDGDGAFEAVEALRLSDGGMGEHGPHAIMKGPDGQLHFNAGNHAHLKAPLADSGPARIFYEGGVLPHYDDSRGHAAGIKAPGGENYRSPDQGQTWERTSGGYRNHYDIAFNRDGEIFTFDSDMEWDIGLPWYRQVRVCHSVLGGDFGWRTGSEDWPNYYFDSLPPTVETGRGSPTGVTFYQGGALPPELDDAFLICDWSQGRLLAVKLTPKGATYEGTVTELVSGQPLNCTDVEVGPDGAVYFTTGGRGTVGGLFKVASSEATKARGARPSHLAPFARKQVQDQIAKGERDVVAGLLKEALEAGAPTNDRLSALDVLVDVNGLPGDEALVGLATRDKDDRVVAKAVGLLGLRTSGAARSTLEKALTHQSAFVRRKACESIVRSGGAVPQGPIVALLADPDAFVRFAARNALERSDLSAIREQLLNEKRLRPLIEGLLVLVRATKLDPATQSGLLARESELLAAGPQGTERLDLLRLIELTYLLGPSKEHEANSAIRATTLGLFPTGDRSTDAELGRLLAYLGEPKAVDAILKAQDAEKETSQQIHYANCLRSLAVGWSPESKSRFLAWFEKASRWDGGFSYLGYLDFMIQDFLPRLDAGERLALLKASGSLTFPARVLVRSLDLNATGDLVAEVAGAYEKTFETTNANAANEWRAYARDRLARARSRAAAELLAELNARERAAKAPALPVVKESYTLEAIAKAVIEPGLIAKASPVRGRAALRKARCLDCHKFGEEGKGVGPDLTTLSSRFKPIDVLEAIVDPSKVISDQYRSVTVEVDDGSVLTGMPIVNDATNLVLLLSDGAQKTIAKKEVVSQKAAEVSVMPAKALDVLTPREVADMLRLFESAPKVELPKPGR